MAKLVNRAKMTTATTGTGTLTLGSAVDGYQTFAAAGVSNADVVRYVIEDGDNWEIGTGTYTASGTTLSRTVTESSNSNAAINLTGNAVVFVTATAADFASGAGGATVSDTPPTSPADGDLWYDTKSGAMFVYYVGPSSSVWVSVADAAPNIPIEFVSQATATTTSISTMPTHKAGDLLLMFAYRNNSNTAPTLPAGWTNIINTGGNTNSIRIAFKIAASASETSGTWTNAAALNLHVYRNAFGVGASGSQNGSGTTLTYDGLTLQQTNGSSQVALFGGHRSTDTSISTPPTGTVLRSNTTRAAGFDTDGGVTSWSQQTVAVGGTSSGWVTGGVELLAKPEFSVIPDTLDFPASPDVGDVYTESGNSFVWNGTAWLYYKLPVGLGYAQSWVSPTRSTNVIYQNTTGKPIFVSVELATGNYGSISFYVAATTGGLSSNKVSTFFVGFNDSMAGSLNGLFYGTVQAVVPDRFYYEATTDGFPVNWWELA